MEGIMGRVIKSIFLFLFIFCFPWKLYAGSVGGFGGALEVTQLMNNAQLMQTYAQEVLQVQNQISQITNQLTMYQNMLTNTQDLINNPFQSAMQTIMNLKQVIDQATQLSYSIGSVDTYFTQLHPNYATLFQGNNYATQQQFWRDSVYNQCEAILKASNFTVSNMQNEAQLMQTLTQASRTAAGQKAAIQAGNNIAVQMAAQLSELKFLTAAQGQSQSIFLTQKKAQEEAQQKYVENLFRIHPNATNPNDNASY
jgi:P-type conjugative transfer protein TrbJ